MAASMTGRTVLVIGRGSGIAGGTADAARTGVTPQVDGGERLT